jgi:ankyrin repeat protein
VINIGSLLGEMNDFVWSKHGFMKSNGQWNHNKALWCDVDEVREALDRGASPHAVDKYQATLLIMACVYGSIDAVKSLLAAGADIHAVNEYGCTALHFVANKGNKELTVFLLEEGADFRAIDSAGTTPLHRARQYGHSELALIFEEHAQACVMNTQFLQCVLSLNALNLEDCHTVSIDPLVCSLIAMIVWPVSSAFRWKYVF